MPFVEAVWLALAQIRVQKLKSFFTLLGVCIGVMFLIAVISIVQGMSSYMENDFAAKMLGVNTFTLRRFPWFGDGASSEEEWRSWLRRPRIYHSDLPLVASVLPEGSRYAVESQEFLQAQTQFARPKQVEAHAVDGDYFTIKKYDVHTGRLFTQQESSLGAPVVVIGDEVAKYFFKDRLGGSSASRACPTRLSECSRSRARCSACRSTASRSRRTTRPCTISPIRAATSTVSWCRPRPR
jgi:putative ABC transport system permease protein